MNIFLSEKLSDWNPEKNVFCKMLRPSVNGHHHFKVCKSMEKIQVWWKVQSNVRSVCGKWFISFFSE